MNRAHKCESPVVARDGETCGRAAKLVAVNGRGRERWVCGTHSNVLESEGWSLRPGDRWQPEGRGVTGWVMVPMLVTADLDGAGRIVEATIQWEMARVARDDFDQEERLEISEPMPDRRFFWEGKDDGKGGIERPKPDEVKRWKDIVFEDMQQWMEEEAEPVGTIGTWLPIGFDNEEDTDE